MRDDKRPGSKAPSAADAGQTMRLNKYLADCGVCSRRDADKLIEAGKVSVNGSPAAVGMRVTPRDTVTVDSKVLQRTDRRVVLAFWKPVGVTCTERDPHADKILSDLIHYPIRVTYAGRLDRDSEGLMLLTNDGGLVDAMMRGANRHEKEYLVRIDREVTVGLLEKLSGGIYLEELRETTRPCEAERVGKYTFRIVLTQGLNRQIRRMCKACGCKVVSLKRVRVLRITLEWLKPGEYRELSPEELRTLYADCGLAQE